MKECKRCLKPLSDYQNLCEECSNLKEFEKNHKIKNVAKRQINDFLSNRDRLFFAYSGGLDSTSALVEITNKSKKKGIEVVPFTIKTGVKPNKTIENIKKVVKFLGIEDNHFFYNIEEEKIPKKVSSALGKEVNVKEYYRNSFKKNKIPCDEFCGIIMNKGFKKALSNSNPELIVTGGDTLEKRGENYSIFSKRGDFVTVRGNAAFNLTKKKSRRLIKKRGVPWEEPDCGGYDTDCLVPGAILRKLNKKLSAEKIIEKNPIIQHYISKRTRFGKISKKKAREWLNNIDIASKDSLEELIRKFNL